MSMFALLFVNDGAPRARILVGTPSDAERALSLLRQKYSDGLGFRIVEVVPESLAAIDAEFEEYDAHLTDRERVLGQRRRRPRGGC